VVALLICLEEGNHMGCPYGSGLPPVWWRGR